MEIKNYKFRDGFSWKADPEKVGKAIEEIAERNKNEVTPAQVVEEARDKRSPLHNCFDWNNKDAANKYRLHQARMLISSLVVEIAINEPEQVRAFINISIPTEGNSYCSISTVVNNEAKIELVIMDARRRMVSLAKQLAVFERLKEFASKLEVMAAELN